METLRSLIMRLDQASADRALASARVPAGRDLAIDPSYQTARAEHVRLMEAVDAELDRLFPRVGG